MTSKERVYRAIRGEMTDRTPIYGWVKANLEAPITAKFGSVEAFEDHYAFDAAHIFGAPGFITGDRLRKLRADYGEITPDILLAEAPFLSPAEGSWDNVRAALAHHGKRERFCYLQTPGFFEYFNSIFGLENQLMYLLLYTDEIAELYRQQADRIIEFADIAISIGVDCIHISDDWGSQHDLLFSPDLWRTLIRPQLKRVIDHVHGKNCPVSLHSDGCIRRVTDDLAELGIDLLHPWQESAGMSYDLYLEKYADKFAIMGGICIQTVLGLVSQDKLDAEIQRIFSLLKGKRWICCTTHFVQDHCSMEDLIFAYDRIREKADMSISSLQRK